MNTDILKKGFYKLCTAKSMAELYEENFKQVSKYVHATSRGHEAIQVALGMQLLPQDYAFPYYRDDAMLLALGMEPYDLMLQLLAKKDDPLIFNPKFRASKQNKTASQSFLCVFNKA